LGLPAGTPVDTENPETKALYMEFLSKKIFSARLSEPTTALSPAEIEARKVIWTIFDILLVLLQKVTALQILNTTTVQNLVEHEKSYSDLMARIFFYIGSGVVDKSVWKKLYGVPRHAGEDAGRFLESDIDARFTQTSPSEIASEFILGYGDITLQEVFESLYNQYKELGPHDSENPEKNIVSFTIESPAWLDRGGDSRQMLRNICDISLTKNSDESMSIDTKMRQITTSLSAASGFSRQESYNTAIQKVSDEVHVYNDASGTAKISLDAEDPWYGVYWDVDILPTAEQYVNEILTGNYSTYSAAELQEVINAAWALKNELHKRNAGNPFDPAAGHQWIWHIGRNLNVQNALRDYIRLLGAQEEEQWAPETVPITLTDPSEAEVFERMNDSFQAIYQIAKDESILELGDVGETEVNGTTVYGEDYDKLNEWEQNQPPERRQAYAQFRDLKLSWDWGILTGGFASGQEPDQVQTVKLNEIRSIRGAINQKLNTYIDTIKSKRDLIKDRADQQRETVEAATSARKMTNEFIQSAIRQLQNILASIFK